MKYLIIGSVLIIALLFGCVQLTNDTNINNDTNTPSIITGDNNSPLIATCSDPGKRLVITDTNEGQIWECV